MLTACIRGRSRLRSPDQPLRGQLHSAIDGTLTRLQDEDRIVLRYVDNPNGSIDDIAGICSEGGNVVGLMPHPERACDALLGSDDGRRLLLRIVSVSLHRCRQPSVRLMPALLSTACGNPGLTPCRVGDPLRSP